MICYITFSEAATAQICADLQAAGKGARLRFIPRSDDGLAIKFYAAVAGGQDAIALKDGCTDPVNDSHICPPRTDC